MKTAIIGAGVMGRTLLSGLQAAGGWDLVASTRSTETATKVAEAFGLPIFTDNHQAVADADLVVLCLKPKNILQVAADVAPALKKHAAVISIAAGVNLADLEAALPALQPLLRAMPNTPCQARAGMTVICPSSTASSEQIDTVKRMFEAVGRALILDEEHINAVTGLSASGPAFIYLVIEALADGGVMSGLPRNVAVELATQTTLGAARMVQETGQHPAALKDAVTTPAGCTISALLRMEDGGLRSVLARGVEEAARRAGGLLSRES
ncbi:MAG: pyrroline-5-carboxylate reductase [Planctomycetes bacterium]|nr:pyrroline-5-carboxylate reductase [Planctomycetota bacterium]